jgi:hypothetical protein
MRKEEGIILMNALRHYVSLCELIIGEKDRLKKWHYEVIEEVVKSCGYIGIT